MIENKDTWIQVGYKLFALEGHSAIKVERIAKKVGISKSSFYHYFADVDTFTAILLEHHLRQSHVLAEKERNAPHIFPELVDILVEHKMDLLFSRELRVHRNNKLFAATLQQSNAIIGDSFILVWLRELNMQLSKTQLNGIFELALENFFLQINKDNFNHQWLTDYFQNLKHIAGRFRE